MHDIWNPWHGCVRCSEGCENCYMYYLDAQRGRNGSEITRTANFDYPLQKDRHHAFRVRSGEQLRVCMTSDFFLEEADAWRDEAWEIIRQRPDIIFYLLTKRPERVAAHLPANWGSGWEHVFFNVTCENQRRADARMPILLELPFRHKGVMCAPLIGEVSIVRYLADGQIEQVLCGGENYGGARPCHFDWVRRLHDECAAAEVKFVFLETGSYFVKDGKGYHIPQKSVQSRVAYRAGVNVAGKPIRFHLTDVLGFDISPSQLYVPHFRESCAQCGSRPICNGCSECGRCK